MTRKKDIHIVPHKDGWAAKREGNKRATLVRPTKADALDKGRQLAKKDKVELVIHKRDGKIQDSDSFGRDPNPPRDKKH